MKGQSVARGRREEIICRWEEGKQLIICAGKKCFYKQPQIIIS